MKKLSLLVALLLIATIGGVYATWTYVGNDQIHTFSPKGVIMEDVEIEGTVGSYTIESNFVQGRIDQAKGGDTDPSKYYKAVLDYELKAGDADAKVTFKFTPNATAGKDIQTKGVTTYLWFGDSGMTYKTDGEGNYNAEGTAHNIFSFTYHTENYITIHPMGTDISLMDATRNFVWEYDNVNKVFYFTFIDEANDIRSMESVFTLNDFVLDVESEYAAFKTAINGFIRTVISNKVPSQTVLPE
ncbi:MAG: hypothetical protein IJV78_01235 [Clostridia bacterium]|nr:hypothetical protein [Clostridia bacterium]